MRSEFEIPEIMLPDLMRIPFGEWLQRLNEEKAMDNLCVRRGKLNSKT